MEISVVLPVYNEVGNLVDVYEEVTAVLETHFLDWELICVDDGSTDGSTQQLVELQRRDDRVQVIQFSRNFGQSAALDAGMKRARGDVVVTMDSDGQNNPADIPTLVDTLRAERYDCVVGWRTDRHDPLSKSLASSVAGALRRRFLDTELHDYGCTLKAFTNEAANAIDVRGEMHRYIPPILKWRGYRVGEVPVNHRERRTGRTKYGWRRLPKGFMDLVNVWFWQKYSARPIHVFGGLGVIAGFIGGVSGLYSVYLKVAQSVSLSDTALPLFAVFMILLGIQFFISGILADISIRNYFHLQEADEYRIRTVHASTTRSAAPWGRAPRPAVSEEPQPVSVDQ
jgi:glycosyltransferase involved in cell wall biosynthesis